MDILEELDQFEPINLDELIQKNDGIPDDVRKSVDLYNKALEDIRHHNEDMAIIALKKAVSINPTFYEAMNLEGLCYLRLENVEQAKGVFKKVIEAENNSIKALGFIQELDDENEGKKPGPKRSRQKTGSWVGNGFEKEPKKPYFLKYIAGFVLGVLVTGLLWNMVPSGKALINNKDEELEKEYQVQQEAYASLQEELNTTKDILKSKETENDQILESFEQYKNHDSQLIEIENLVEKSEYLQAADKLLMLQTIQFEEGMESRYNSLWEAVMPIAAETIYNDATKIYFGKSSVNDVETCKEALKEFERVIQLGQDWDFMPDFYYVAGKCAARAENTGLAKKWFNQLIEQYPNHGNADYAKNRVTELEEGRPISGN